MRYTAEEVVEKAKHAPAILLPLASIEILGKHGPVGLDLLTAEAVTARIAQRTGCLAAPPVPYGDTQEFCRMDGTIHIPARVLEEYIYAVAASLFETCGANAVIFLCFHSLNQHAASAACRRLTEEGRQAACADWWAAVGAAGADLLQDEKNGRGHGSEMISSVALAVCGELVHLDRAVCEEPKPALAAVTRWNGSPFTTYGNFSQYCTSGAWGNICSATREKGELLLARGIDAISEFITTAFPR